MTVRLAGVGDIPGMLALLCAVAAENRWIRTEVPVDVAGRERRLRTGFAQGTVLGFVAERSGEIVGDLTMRVDGSHAAFGMMLAAGERGRGLGRRLLAFAIAHARTLELTHLALEVYVTNAAALALYRSLGFRVAGADRADLRADGSRWAVRPMILDLRDSG